LRTNPGAVFDDYGFVTIRHVGLGVVVIACAQERTLRNATVGADGNRFQIENENLLANPCEVANNKFPGKVNVDARFDNNPLAYTSAKGSQQGTL